MNQRKIYFRACTTEIDYDRLYMETIFEDGARAIATPVWDRDRPMAVSLGYGETDHGVVAMWRHHDPLHTLIAERLGHQYSSTLWGVAHGKFAPRRIWQGEEARVLAFQRLLNGRPVEDVLDPLWHSGETPESLVSLARAMFDWLDDAAEVRAA